MGDQPHGRWTCFDLTIEDKVAHIRFNRPEAANSMNRAFWSELPAIVNEISDEARARCIVISAMGKHFCSGMDLSLFTAEEGLGGRGDDAPPHIVTEGFMNWLRWLQTCISCLDEARMPVIAAVQGACLGGGVDLISACDIRYAAADAFFCIQEINIAITADVGTFPRLCRLIPEGWVRELAYTGRRLPAEKAKAIGLVNEIYPDHATMLDAVLGTAREIAAKDPLVVTGCKTMINYARDHTTADALDYIALWQSGMLARGHMREAFQAQKEKRTPRFPDLAALKKGL